INLVTERAEDEPLTRVTASYVSQANVTAQLDVGRRFGENKEWGVRFNGVKRGGEATSRDGKQDLGMAALGVDYRGARLRWSADVIHIEDTLAKIRHQLAFIRAMTHLHVHPDT